MTPCACGYQDHRFCPTHGVALRQIIGIAAEHGAIAGEALAEAFEDTEAVCAACDRSTPERDAFWRAVEESAASARARPAWEHAGIDLNPTHFETYQGAGEPEEG